MHRRTNANKQLAKLIALLVLASFIYYSAVEQFHSHLQEDMIEIRVSRTWFENFRSQRSLLSNNGTGGLHELFSRENLLSHRNGSISRLLVNHKPIENTIGGNLESKTKNRSVVETEYVARSSADFDVDAEISEAAEKFTTIQPNVDFVFHNKLPKSGSSTMNNILKILRRKNKFKFLKLESGTIPSNEEKALVEHVKAELEPPYLLLKHHYWMNFTKFELSQPTFINVIRDPIEWFTSHYYFQRFGWKRKPGCRTATCGMSAKELEMTIDECVAMRHRHCTAPWNYLAFFCGTTKECSEASTTDEKRMSLRLAKKRLIDDFYLVGILEQFEDTLLLLERTLPRFFKGAVSTWKGKFVQEMQDLTRTVKKQRMSEESRHFFETGPLKYEIEFYNFARKLFNAKLKKISISSKQKRR